MLGKMKLQVNQYFNNRVPLPPICYQLGTTVDKKPEYKFNSLKVDIKTQPVEVKSVPILLYVSFFDTVSPEGILKFLDLIDKTIKGQSLTTGP